MRLPTYKELRRYVDVEGWQDKDAASGKKEGDHHRYVFTTPTGERLFTKISHGRSQINDADLFGHILRDQLHIDEEQFWVAVDRGVIPARPSPTITQPTDALDAKLARNLLKKVGLKPQQLTGMTQEEALRLWHEWLSGGGG